jgi:hypothetical protein
MPVKVYFDGSSDHDDLDGPKILTLAAICATDASWARFDEKWKALLENHRSRT